MIEYATLLGLSLSANWSDIAYNNSLFVAVADSYNYAATSPDGINWTQYALPASVSWKDIIWNGSFFVVIATSSSYVATSSTGISWGLQGIRNSFGTNTITSIAYNTITNSYIAAGTNGQSYAWQAYVGGTKMAFGTTTNAAGSATSVVFPFTYASPPTVVISPQGGTNSVNAVSVMSVSITNFTVLATVVQTIGWISVGTVYNPQTEYQGNFPVNNKVLTP